jgi:hypothetical protein
MVRYYQSMGMSLAEAQQQANMQLPSFSSRGSLARRRSTRARMRTPREPTRKLAGGILGGIGSALGGMGEANVATNSPYALGANPHANLPFPDFEDPDNGMQTPDSSLRLSQRDLDLIERKNQRDLRDTAEREIANTPGGIDYAPGGDMTVTELAGEPPPLDGPTDRVRGGTDWSKPEMMAGDATGGGRGGSRAQRELMKVILAASPQDRVPKPGEPTVAVDNGKGSQVLVPRRLFDKTTTSVMSGPKISDADRAALQKDKPQPEGYFDWGMGLVKSPAALTPEGEYKGEASTRYAAQMPQRLAKVSGDTSLMPPPGAPTKPRHRPARHHRPDGEDRDGRNSSGRRARRGCNSVRSGDAGADRRHPAGRDRRRGEGDRAGRVHAARRGRVAADAGGAGREAAQARQQFVDAQMQKLQTMQDAFDKGQIDPHHLYASMSTPQKITAGLGVFLGAIGGALTGSPNEALGIIQKAIDRDIDAQKTNLSKKGQAVEGQRSMLGMYRQQFGDEAAADAATRATMLQNAAMQAEAAGAKYAAPELKAKAHQDGRDAQAGGREVPRRALPALAGARDQEDGSPVDGRQEQPRPGDRLAQLKGGGKGGAPVDAALDALTRLEVQHKDKIAGSPLTSLRQHLRRDRRRGLRGPAPGGSANHRPGHQGHVEGDRPR